LATHAMERTHRSKGAEITAAEFLAEEERFELSVRFCRAKPRRIRKLQRAKPCQRISSEIRHQNWAISPVSIRHLFVRERRRQGDSVAKKRSVREVPSQSDWVRRTACLPRSPKTKNLSAGNAPRKANNRNFQRFLVMLCRDFRLSVRPAPLTSKTGRHIKYRQF
jgi:hypothetical protein